MKTKITLLVAMTCALALSNSPAQPTIDTPPADQTAIAGSNATFCVTASGTPPLSYQWRHDLGPNIATNLPGESNACLTLVNVQPAQNLWRVSVVVSNPSGSVTSQVARLTVVTPPAIVVQPGNGTVDLGQTYSNQVVASGTPPLAYQWFFNGQPLTDKTNSTVTIPNIQPTNGGAYAITITGPYGSVTSRVATVFVVPGATFTRITQGPVATDSEPSTCGAWGDYDNDGLLDLFVSNAGSGGYRNTLYRNLGGDDFVRVTNALTATAGRTWGAQWADVDNDGDLDILVHHPATSWSPAVPALNEMFRNDGGGIFTSMTNAATSVAAFWTDASWVDHNCDGRLDLFATTQLWGGRPLNDNFFHSLADGQFAAWTTNEVGVLLDPKFSTAGPAWCDIDGDGDLDLYVSKLNGATNFLYRNDGGRLIPVKAGSLPAGRSTWAATWADFNNDGLFDLFTGGENGTNMLHLNRGNWVFEDVTVASGLALTGAVYNATAGDFDNDGDLDLYVPDYNLADVLYVNRGDGIFDRANVGAVLTAGTHNSGTWADYNNDGFLDLFEPCGGDGIPTPNFLYRNSLPQYGNTNHWLKLRLKGTVSNASAIGARVSARAIIGGKETSQIRQITSGFYGTASLDGLLVHFGLGDATRVETLIVEWPSGAVQTLNNVTAGQFLTVTEEPQPQIAMPPVDLTNCLGSTAVFSVAATGARPLAYQWRYHTTITEFTNIPSATNASLALEDVQPNTGRFAVAISNASGSVTSRLARLTVLMAPRISQQATSRLALTGQSFTNSVITTGSPPIYFQWYFNGQPLPGKTANPLVISNAQLTNEGDYHVVISNACGTFTGDTARLTVIEGPIFTKITGQSIVDDREASELGAWCDYDGDGYLDLFVANSMNANPASRNSLYHNEGNGSFTRVTNALTARAVNTWGSQWADYDNDGRPDLFMTHQGGPASELFRNLGGGEFEAVSTPFLLPNQNQVDGAWGDLDGDGWVDLVVSTWQSAKDQAFRNLGDGRFQLLSTNEVGALVADSATTGASSFADFDNDGDPDLYVSCESGPAFLFRNRGGGMYDKAQLGSLPATPSTVSGVWGDFNNDGFFDLLTTARNDFPALHMNVGGQTFQDVTTTAGLMALSGAAWGPAWGDVDNDGDLDLFIPYYSSINRMFFNNGDGTFTSVDVGSPLREGVNDESAVWVDYDNDGFLDLFVACGEANPSPNLLYRNNLPATGNTNHWLKVQLTGIASNRSAIGAKIRVRAVIHGEAVSQLRQITSNGGFASGTELLAHFGLGDATNVETLRVEWPSGQVTELHNVPAGQILTVTEAPGLRAMGFAQGAMQMQLTAHPGMNVGMEISSNLVDWVPWRTLPQTNRTMIVTDPEAGQHAYRFYKVRVK